MAKVWLESGFTILPLDQLLLLELWFPTASTQAWSEA